MAAAAALAEAEACEGTLLSRMTAPDAVARRRGGRRPHPQYAGDTWLGAVLLMEGRTADRIVWPWLFVMATTAAWTVPVLVYRERTAGALVDLGAYATAHSALQTVLSFLLVFRLNRSAERFWATRQLWGKLVEVARQLSATAATHLSGPDGDALLAWCCAFAVASKCLLRGGALPALEDALAGILTKEECAAVAGALSPSLFCASGMCASLASACAPGGDVPSALQLTAVFGVLQLRIDELVGCIGGMERIKATPLPIAYVSHLRTFLLGYLVCMPLVYLHSWR